jgi:hypothetical protein
VSRRMRVIKHGIIHRRDTKRKRRLSHYATVPDEELCLNLSILDGGAIVRNNDLFSPRKLGWLPKHDRVKRGCPVTHVREKTRQTHSRNFIDVDPNAFGLP